MPSPGYFLADAQITTAQVTTTDATPTVLYSFAIPTNCVGSAKVLIVGRKSDGSDRARYFVEAPFYRASSAGALAAGPYIIAPDYESDAAWDYDVDVSSSTLRVLVTGAASTTIAWTARVEIVTG